MLLVTSASLLAGVAVFLVLSSLLVPSTRLLDRLPQAAAVAASTGKADRPAPFADRVVAPVVATLSETLGRVLPARIRERTQDQLEMAGRNRTDWTKFVALQVVAGVVLAGLALLMPFSAGLKVLFVPLLLFLGYRLPSFFVARSISKRNRQIERALPDAVDLLVVCLEAGLAFDGAVSKLVEKSRGPLAQEFARALHHMYMGQTRREALNAIVQRTNVTELHSVIHAVVQAERTGAPVARGLRAQAEQVRIRMRQRAEEQAMKAPVKIAFPLVLFIFPSLMMVMLAPAAIDLL